MPSRRFDSGSTPRGVLAWARATGKDCIRVAREAEVARIVLFHHDAFHSDEEVARKETLAGHESPEAVCAFDGMKTRI